MWWVFCCLVLWLVKVRCNLFWWFVRFWLMVLFFRVIRFILCWICWGWLFWKLVSLWFLNKFRYWWCVLKCFIMKLVICWLKWWCCGKFLLMICWCSWWCWKVCLVRCVLRVMSVIGWNMFVMCLMLLVCIVISWWVWSGWNGYWFG